MQSNIYQTSSNNGAVTNPVSNAIPEYLRYLFIAEFDDGTQIAQTPEDKSEHREDKSAFWDVQYQQGDFAEQQPEQVKKLIRFHLTDRNNWYTVDLRDGLFEINGLPFAAHDQLFTPNQPLTLIYFRETKSDLHGSGEVNQYVNRYFLGWWCLDGEGNKLKQTIAIA